MPSVFAPVIEDITAKMGRWEREVRKASAAKSWHAASLAQLIDGGGKPPRVLIDTQSEGVWYPPSLSDQQHAEVTAALPAAHAALMPAEPEATAVILRRLAVMVILPEMSEQDFDLMMDGYFEQLEHVPADVLDHARHQWTKREKFWPRVPELLELCEPELNARRQRLFRLATLDSIGRNPAPESMITWEWEHERFRDARRTLPACGD